MMAIVSILSVFYFLSTVFLGFADFKVAAETTDFSCSVETPWSCDTYVTYRVRPPYMDLNSISNLLGVNQGSIARANGLASEGASLFPDQILLVPIMCSCNGSNYFFNATYQIKKGDNFYSVSTGAFENLTSFVFVEDMNPMMKVTNLTVGDEAVFPLLCKCVNHSSSNVQYLITYVWQPFDDVLSVSKRFGASEADIVRENNNRNFSAAICLPVLIPSKTPKILQHPPPPPLQSRRRRWNLVIGLFLSGSFLIVSLCLIAYRFLENSKKKALGRQSSGLETSDLIKIKKGGSGDETFEPKIVSQDKLLPGISGYLGKPKVYDLNVIMEATMNLSERFRVGGSVYRAIIDNQILAVKKTRDAAEELRILLTVNHANLVKLLGISSDTEKNFYLVYEFVENGSLDEYLFTRKSGSSILNWTQRLQIALEIATALQYLHEHTRPCIAHRDIRASNILLDSRFKPKISNFSLAKHGTSQAMLKADIFAFGVLLLELISGRKGMEIRDDGEVSMLWKEIRAVLGENDGDETRDERFKKWIDSKMSGLYSIDDALSLAALARACTSEKSSERPTMTDIVFNLSFIARPMFGVYESCSTSCDAEEPVLIISAR